MRLPRPRLAKIAIVIIAFFLLLYFNIPSGQRTRHPLEQRVDGKGQSRVRAEAVRAAFGHGWEGYVNHAFPNDDLRPLSNTFQNTRYK